MKPKLLILIACLALTVLLFLGGINLSKADLTVSPMATVPKIDRIRALEQKVADIEASLARALDRITVLETRVSQVGQKPASR